MAQATKAVEGTAKGAEDAAKKADTAMGQMVKSAQNSRQAWDTAGGTLTAFGAASVGALGLAAKSALDWESSWAGVTKTVEGTAPQMAALEDGLRGLARELPASHTEIAAVAEAAGQLGIETPNILDFTKTMVNMGVATNMSSEEAATSLARFMNVMGTSQSEVGRLGATVVGLGNSFATTESEIVQMSQRLSGAGAQAGLTEGDVMGIATAMSSVGIEAEAGGSAMSLTMKRIGKAVDEGGESLDLFAQVSGMSAEQFVKAWRDDPAMALDGFINGLSTVEQQGMTTNGVLGELGITGIRESDALLRLSAAAGQGADGMSLLAQAVQQGNEEFNKGSALIEEASKRYETAESRIAMAKNALVDAGISIGSVVLPALAELADGVADTAGWFADLPGPVHGTVAALGGVAGAGALAAGSFLLIFPRVMDTVQAFKTLKTDMPGVAGGLGKVGRAAAVAGAAFVGLQVLGAVVDHFAEARITAEEFSASLLNASTTSDVTAASINELIQATGTGNATVTGLGNALDILDAGGFAKFMDQVNAGFGVWDTQGEIAAEQVAKLDQAMTTLAQSGSADQMAEAWQAALDASGRSAEELLDALPGLRTELTNTATEMGLAADDATLLGILLGDIVPPAQDAMGAAEGLADGLEGVEDAAGGAADALGELYDEMFALADGFLNGRSAVRDYKEALIEAKDVLNENGKAWGDSTEKARENGEALDTVAQAALDNADAMKRNGEDVGGYLQGQREILWDLAKDFGATDEQATAYVDSLGLIPEEIDTAIELETQVAKDQWAALWSDLGTHPPQVPVGADTQPAEDSLMLFEDGIVSDDPTLAPVDANVELAEQTVGSWTGALSETPPGEVPVGANVEPAQWEVDMLVAAVDAREGVVDINGEPVPAESVLSTLMGEINSSDGTVTIDGRSVPAEQALLFAIEAINSGSGTVTIEGNNKPAKESASAAGRHADGTDGTIKVYADTSSANSSINNAARNRSSTIWVTWQQTNSRPSTRPGVRTATFATGGAVWGAGTGTSDSIPALLSNGEHVITAAEVARAGGQDAIYRLRAAINSGLKFANGGGVENGGYARAPQLLPQARMMSGQSGPSTLTLDGAALAALAGAVRDGASQATIGVSPRGAGQLVKVGTAHNGRAGG